MAEVIGRDAELDTARSLLERTDQTLACLLIRGEAGIGKTNLWTEVMHFAHSVGHRVLKCRSVEAESPLPFVALGDLLASVEPERRVSLPPPQRRALEIALLEAEAVDRPLQSRAVGAGLASLLRESSGERPLVIGVDDAHWIDRSSEAVLAFALRRLLDLPITIVVSSREGVPPLVVDLPDITTLDLEPLDLAGTFHLLRNQLGRVYPRPTLVRLWEMSGGNPLYAMEAARALEASARQPAPSEPLPLPPTGPTSLRSDWMPCPPVPRKSYWLRLCSLPRRPDSCSPRSARRRTGPWVRPSRPGSLRSTPR